MRTHVATTAVLIGVSGCGGGAAAPREHTTPLGDPAPVVAQRTPLTMAVDPAAPVRGEIPAAGEACALQLARAPRDGCRLLFPVAARASSNEPDAGLATDGSTCSIWNAGGVPPQELTIDLGTPTRVDVIVLVPEMTPSGSVDHAIAVSDDGRSFSAAHAIRAPMQTGVPVELVLPKAERARFVRVTTKASPSFVAWREVGLFRCGAE